MTNGITVKSKKVPKNPPKIGIKIKIIKITLDAFASNEQYKSDLQLIYNFVLGQQRKRKFLKNPYVFQY